MLIVEGLVTTLSEDGSVNVAPMGPIVEEAAPWRRLVLRPFQGSQTFRNLLRTREGVFHATDDVLLLARATIGRVEAPTEPSEQIRTPRLADCCRYFEFRVERVDDRSPRRRMEAAVVHEGRVRDFLGLNRGKHAVVEAAILASRVGLLERAEVRGRLADLRPLVEKTGGAAEHAAFDLLARYVEEYRGRGEAAP
jgi:hypothetical protein